MKPFAVAPEEREILQHAVEEAARLLHADGGVIYLVEDGQASLRFAQAAGITDDRSRESLAGLRLPLGEGLFGLTVTQRQANVTGDYLTDDRFRHTAPADAVARDLGVRSMVVAPIVVGDEAMGALGAYVGEPDRFGEAEMALVGALAGHAAVAIANARLIEEIAASRVEISRRAATEQALRELAAGISAIRDSRELLQRTVEAAATLLGADGAIVDLLDPSTGRIHWAYDAGIEDSPERAWLRTIELAPGEGVFGRAFADDHVFNTGDYLHDDRVPRGPAPQRFAEGFGVQSSMAAPLRSDAGPIGALGVWARRAAAWDETDEATIQALADQASIAVTNARLIEQLETSELELARRVETERALRTIASRITAVTDLDHILQPLVDDAKRIMGSDDAHLTLMSDTGRYLTPVVIAGGSDPDTHEWLKQERFPLEGGINGLAASRNDAVWTEDYMVDPRVPHEPGDQDTAARLGLRAVAVVPLRAPEGSVLGTLAVSFREPRTIAPEEVDLLQAMGNHAAIAIANSRLYARLGASEARFRYLVESSPDIVWQADAEGTFVYLSDTTLPVLGWEPSELVGRHFSSVIAPEDYPMIAERWSATQREPGVTQHYRFGMLHRDGHRILGEVHGRAIMQDGKFVGANGSVRDVSEQVRLERDLRQQAAELAASQERGHLARELHDSVTQALFSMTLLTRTVELLVRRDPDAAIEKLAGLRELQRDALAEMRSLIFELRPGSLADDGLIRALRTHTAAVQGRLGLPIVLTADDIGRMPIDVEEALYRIAQEALHNVVKHAGASQVRVTVTRDRESVRLAVEDNGTGFDQARVGPGHLGLAGMRVRAEKVGAQLDVASRRGHGTRVQVVVPDVPEIPSDAPERAAAPAAPAVARQMT